ncbi:Golgi CORVET complex core vacuolar protein 8-domain-containing protein [Cunninghamella echinulata]|nr:Golgi CORVET complex core vacuolar protein 8-domain-containing protein [Cunninghamella echinulata]
MNYDSSSFATMSSSPAANDGTGNNNISNWPTLSNLTLTPSQSSNTISFRKNYDTLLKEVLEGEDDDTQLNMIYGSDQQTSIDIDLDAATAELPDELRAALEDRALADKYLANLKTFMSHQRSHSMGSIASAKGDYSSPTTPLQPTFNIQPTTNSTGFNIQQDPLSKVLDAVPYQTRLINGVQSLLELEKKLIAIKIPELDLPTVSDTVIKARLNDLYKIQDDLYIHLHGGPLVRNVHRLPIGDKKKKEIDRLLDQVSKEIGLYEEFVKRDNYLSLENILNESDSDDYQDSDIFDTESSIAHFETSSDISKVTSGTPSSPRPFSVNGITSSGTSATSLRRVISQSSLASLKDTRRFDTSSLAGDSIQSFDAISDPSMSQLLNTEDNKYSDEPSTPSEAFKWTPLKKISDHLYSKDIRQQSGLVSVLAVSGVIAVGTTRSLVYIYDYSQNLKCVLGDSHRAVELGAVTSLAISADYTTIACGYSKGHIVIWDIRKPQQPIRTIDPIPVNQLLSASPIPNNTNTINNNDNNNNSSNDTSSPSTSPSIPFTTTPQPGSRKEGHIHGAAILHIGFIGVKKTEIVSGDDQGMAFYHVLYKVMMVNAVDTTRILGRYQNLSFSPIGLGLSDFKKHNTSSSSLSDALSSSSPSSIPAKFRRPSTVFAMQPLPLGQIPHAAENFALVALLTPYKMIIVGLKPSPQTKYKFLKPKTNFQSINTSSSTTTATNTTATHQNDTQQQQQQQNQQQPNDVINENLSGCLAWLPVTKPNGSINKDIVKDKRFQKESVLLSPSSSGDPMLAFAWGNHLIILRVGVETIEPQRPSNRFRTPKPKRGTKLEFIKIGESQLDDAIIGLQWINRQIIVLFTPNEEMILFDPKRMVKIEHTSIRYKQLVYHDWFSASLRDLTKPTIETIPNSNDIDINSPNTVSTTTTVKTIEMAYYHSLKGYKGKLFLLGLERLYVGHLLSWADRILVLMKAGDFLEAIQLATAFYNGNLIQTVIGLPEDEQQRKQLVGEKLMELLKSSLNYVFNPSRKPLSLQQQQNEGENTMSTTLTTNGTDMMLIDRKRNIDAYDNNSDALLYQELAKCCVNACLSMDDEIFLFETAYEQFAENGVQGYFLEILEEYIVSKTLQTIPPDIMKDLVTHYSTYRRLDSLERIIWHVNPECLEFQQILTICQREGLYEAMMYLWNISSQDFVSPLVEMLKVIRQLLSKTEDKNQNNNQTNGTIDHDVRYRQAEKVFDYLKMVLRGLTYPEGTPIKSPIHRRESSTHASEARSAVYSFIFSGRCLVWPRVGGKLVLTVDESDVITEPTYPYLRLLLRFNTKKFLETLEVAFEDPWLNGGDDIVTSTFEGDVLQGKVISRQIIVNTLFDVMGGRTSTTPALQVPTNNSNNNSYLSTPRLRPSISASTVHSGINNTKGSGTSSETTSSYYDDQYQNDSISSTSDDLLQLYIFIANNLPKYTTFIYLSLTTRQQILLRLTINDRIGYRNKKNDDDTRNERQKAVQELLTVYTPNNEEAMISLYEEAKFWNVLEDVHRRDKRYGKLVETYLKNTTDTLSYSLSSDTTMVGCDDSYDEDHSTKQYRVFDCVEHLLDDTSILTDRQRQDVKNTILIRISQFVDIDGQRTADLIQKYLGANHYDIVKRLSEDVEFDDDDEDEDEVDRRLDMDNNNSQSSPSILSNGMVNDHFTSIKSSTSHVRMADKRIFSYLRGLLEPQYLISPSTPPSSAPKHSFTINNNMPSLFNNESVIDDDTYIMNNDLQQQQQQHNSALIQRSNINANIQEKYIDLMCRFDPSGVYDYLNTKLYDYETHMNQFIAQQQLEDNMTGEINHLLHGSYQINLDTLLKSCETYGVIDAVVWIMEKKGQIQGALEKILEVGKEKVQMILQIIQQQQSWTFEDQSKISTGLIGLSGVLRVGTRLCENSTGGHGVDNNNTNQEIAEEKIKKSNKDGDGDDDDDIIESLWFRLLDIYVESSMEIHSALDKKKNPHLSLPIGVQQYIISTFKSFVQSILTSLLLSTSPQVSLPRLLLRLIDSQTKGETTFADFRDIFLSMLDTYKYEGQLLELTNRLFDRDLFLGVQENVRHHKKGWRPQSTLCTICRATVLNVSLMQPDIWQDQQQNKEGNEKEDEKDKKVVVYQCGHVYHHHCLDLQLGDNHQGQQRYCIICNHHQQPSSSTTTTLKSSTNQSKETVTVDKGKSKAV